MSTSESDIMVMRLEANSGSRTASPTPSHPSAAALLFGASAADSTVVPGIKQHDDPLEMGSGLATSVSVGLVDIYIPRTRRRAACQISSALSQGAGWHWGLVRPSGGNAVSAEQAKKTEGERVTEHCAGVVSRRRWLNEGFGNGSHLFLS